MLARSVVLASGGSTNGVGLRRPPGQSPVGLFAAPPRRRLARSAYEDPAGSGLGTVLHRRGDVCRGRHRPATARADKRRLSLDALELALTDIRHRLLDETPARLGRAVREVEARLPAAVVGLVGDVEDQEAADRRLARSHLQRLAVVRGLRALRNGLRQLASGVEAALGLRNLGIDAVLVVDDRQLGAELRS